MHIPRISSSSKCNAILGRERCCESSVSDGSNRADSLTRAASESLLSALESERFPSSLMARDSVETVPRAPWTSSNKVQMPPAWFSTKWSSCLGFNERPPAPATYFSKPLLTSFPNLSLLLLHSRTQLVAGKSAGRKPVMGIFWSPFAAFHSGSTGAAITRKPTPPSWFSQLSSQSLRLPRHSSSRMMPADNSWLSWHDAGGSTNAILRKVAPDSSTVVYSSTQ
mmetsp:Transcript_5156/g.32363  ORF Transcript_5156/g.32363 Transcript_5156/m.32363 type:complete len:224 (+) Transcript_5156:2710-3381(+)